jgi:hypothetical protein
MSFSVAWTDCASPFETQASEGSGGRDPEPLSSDQTEDPVGH